jgi:hypothetical protein
VICHTCDTPSPGRHESISLLPLDLPDLVSASVSHFFFFFFFLWQLVRRETSVVVRSWTDHSPIEATRHRIASDFFLCHSSITSYSHTQQGPGPICEQAMGRQALRDLCDGGPGSR